MTTRTKLSRSKGPGHHAALLSAALTSNAAAAVSVGTYSAWESTEYATLCRQARRLGAHRGRRGTGRGGVAAARLQLVSAFFGNVKITSSQLR